jgi:hypothetical protein
LVAIFADNVVADDVQQFGKTGSVNLSGVYVEVVIALAGGVVLSGVARIDVTAKAELEEGPAATATE